ncbi:AAA family ATPase [Candidatus Thalassolituus haligoni]|uniref:AAA family ATPase n=1 Tax=Candidatus Thalassolituus haligoni TaxID=3100113 RepID=UPI003519A13A
MLKQATLRNLTVFKQADLAFSPGLNVVVGENGSGKSHLLKAIYALIATSAQEGLKPQSEAPTKTLLQKAYADKLMNVLRPEYLGRLARRKQGRERCELSLQFVESNLDIHISFATNSKSDVQVDQLPINWQDKAPVFIPTREVLSTYHWLSSLYRTSHVDIEENLIDLCDLLGALSVKGPGEKKVAELVSPLEQAMGGKVILEPNGRFYLSIPGSGKMEMPLVAEGLRKLAMVARLISTGSLLDKGYLLWDEPEANLNPKLIKVVAALLLNLSLHGIQVIVATHSLFLLRELEILSGHRDYAKLQNRYFALCQTDGGMEVEQGNHLDDLQTLVLLDEELTQSDRFMESQG